MNFFPNAPNGLFNGLPISEDDRADHDFFPVKSIVPENYKFIAGGDKSMYDLVFIGPYCGLCELAVSVDGEGSADIQEGMEVMSTHLTADPAENAFATIDAEVWCDPVTFLLSDTYAAGRYGIGPLSQVKDADGSIRFKKRRFYITEPVMPPT